MNKIILILSLLFSSNILFSQSILDIVTKEENFIVSNTKFEINNYINKLYFKDISDIIDENTFKEFKNEISKKELKMK